VILVALGPYSIQRVAGAMEAAALPGFVLAVVWAVMSAALVGALLAPSALKTHDPLRKGIAASIAFATLFVVGGLALAQILAWFGIGSQAGVAYAAVFGLPAWVLGFMFGIPFTCIAVWWLRGSYRAPPVQTSLTGIRVLAAALVAFVAIDLIVNGFRSPV
jgi:cytochrome bd-type quinol oxidase subunit 2